MCVCVCVCVCVVCMCVGVCRFACVNMHVVLTSLSGCIAPEPSLGDPGETLVGEDMLSRKG